MDAPNLDIPHVSIIIPTYGLKGVALTQQCLNSIWSSGMARGGRALIPEIIVIDDGSDDAAMDELREVCRENGAALFHNPANTGNFAHNVNIGIQASSGNVVVLLNNDVQLLPGCVQALVDAIYTFNFGIAAPKLLYPDGTIQFGGTVYIPNSESVTAHGHFDHMFRHEDRFLFEACRSRICLVTGACMAIARNTFDMIGLFDERLLLAAEDVDVCLRALTAGVRVGYMGFAEAVHHEGQTRGRTVEEKAMHPKWTAQEEAGLNFLFEKWSATDFGEFGVRMIR